MTTFISEQVGDPGDQKVFITICLDTWYGHSGLWYSNCTLHPHDKWEPLDTVGMWHHHPFQAQEIKLNLLYILPVPELEPVISTGSPGTF